MDYDLPPPPVLTEEERAQVSQWAAICRGHLERIKSQRKWQPVLECPICRIDGLDCPVTGCTEHHPYIDWRPSPWQAKIWYSHGNSFICVTSGHRAGKTYNSAAVIFHFATGLPPLWFLAPERVNLLPLLLRPRRTASTGRVIWASGVNADNLENGIVRYLKMFFDGTGLLGSIHDHTKDKGLKVTTEIHVSDEWNGSRIEIKRQDQNAAPFMSGAIDLFVEDEEFHGPVGEEIRHEGRGRLVDREGVYLVAVTAVDTAHRSGESKLAKDIIGPCERGTIKPPGFYRYFKVSTLENIYQTPEALHQIDVSYRDPNTGEITDDWLVRVAGAAIGVNISPVLLQSSLHYMEGHRARPPIWTGNLVAEATWVQRDDWKSVPTWVPTAEDGMTVRKVADAAGPLKIWLHPRDAGPCIVGCDAGHGVQSGGNPSAAWVYSRLSGKFVALWWGIIDAVSFARELIKLGHYYDDAWLCVEGWGGSGGPGVEVVGVLAGRDLGYPRYTNLYHHGRQGYEKVNDLQPGYPATTAGKQALLDSISNALRPKVLGDPSTIPIDIPDMGTIQEMLSIKRDPKTGLVVYPTDRSGDKTTHCDRAVAAGLALAAARSGACPLDMEQPTRARLNDPSAELATRSMERLVQEQEEEEVGHSWKRAPLPVFQKWQPRR